MNAPLPDPSGIASSAALRLALRRLAAASSLAWLAFCLPLNAATPASAPDSADFETQGITEPFLDATLSAPVAGIIGKHFFKEGDTVEAGQVIVELDKRMEELEVARRQVVLENSAEVLRRTEELANRTRSVAKEELDKQRAESRIAQAELDLAREQLRRRQLIAPFSGVVADLFNLDAGEGCQPQTPIARLVDTRRCWLVANLEARRAQMLKVGQQLTLHLESDVGTRIVEAEIRFISPVADPASGLVRVKALFNNSESRIPAGITANVRIPRTTSAPVSAAPPARAEKQAPPP